jgi:hypothetical protein
MQKPAHLCFSLLTALPIQYFQNMYESVGYRNLCWSQMLLKMVRRQLPAEGSINRGLSLLNMKIQQGYDLAKANLKS